MTVCIAAICRMPDGSGPGSPMIVGASDRMYSTPDTGYEPFQTKIVNLTDQVVALIAGDVAAQIAITGLTMPIIEKEALVQVADIAGAFADSFAKYRRQEAERCALTPLGLDTTSFIASQKTMDVDQVKRLTDVLQGWELEVETIIAGVDPSGAHVWRVVDPGRAVCENASGFVAIGIGRNHAVSQFIRARFTNGAPFSRTLSLIYSAKRRAEAAPGVGETTDLFAIGPGQQGFYNIWREDIHDKLADTYRDMVDKEEAALAEASETMEEYVAEILEQANEPQPEPGAEDESGTTADEGGVSSDREEGEPEA